MANIKQCLDNIMNATYGEEVRDSIHDGIKQCYEDAAQGGNSSMEIIDARGLYNTLGKRLDDSDKLKADKETINKMQLQINELASGSPLVANSLEGMTDESRVYVNTTDGNWYYYNGTTWVSGGTYQASKIADNSISVNMLNKELQTNINMIATTTFNDDGTIKELYKDNSYKITSFSGNEITEEYYSEDNNLIWSKTTTINNNTIVENLI